MRYFDPPTAPCVVCQEVIVDEHYAECSYCLRAFHLRMTESAVNAKDCGIVGFNDQEMVAEFVCIVCLEGAQAPDESPRVR